MTWVTFWVRSILVEVDPGGDGGADIVHRVLQLKKNKTFNDQKSRLF
jgi:hypothetical protein